VKVVHLRGAPPGLVMAALRAPTAGFRALLMREKTSNAFR
jgi:hypothetical protein